MSTVVMLIFFLTLKGVIIGKILLIMNVIFFAVKIATLKHSNYMPQWSQQQQWQPPPPNYWPKQPAAESGGVHVHIHNAEPVIHVTPVTPPTSNNHYEPYAGSYPPANTFISEPYGAYLPSYNNNNNNFKPATFAKRSF